MGEDRALELRGVTKLYSGIAAVNNVSFAAAAGEVTAYLGPNGSGKSTTLKIITGLLEPTEGSVLFDGRAIQQDRIGYKQRLGYVPEEAQIYPRLTAYEYLEMVGGLRGFAAPRIKEKTNTFLRLFSLDGDSHVPMSSYSKGMRQKVVLAAALLHNPDLMVLDEPFSGLDISSALVLTDLIRELAARGKVVLFSAHELHIVERVSSRVVILHRGSVVANDRIEELRSLLSLPSLEEIFSQLVVEQDTRSVARELVAAMDL
ncbi:MAG: ABC transporter ATP-binding protein [Acidobacteriaceae bacterium]|nr:ABC transporter ATP-binding protein [Acidobacteriaceae bacterium]